MGLFGTGGSKLTGVDIGASSVKIVSGSMKGRTFNVEELVIVPLPHKAIDERGIANYDVVSNAVTTGLAELGKKNVDVSTMVHGGGIITRRITIPKIPQREIPDQVKWEAQQVFPQDISSILVEYILLGEGKNVPNAPADTVGWDLMLIGVREEEAQALVNLIKSGGGNVKHMDLDSFVSADFLDTALGLPKDQPIALVDVGASATRVAVKHKGAVVYVREFGIGGNAFTETMAMTLGLSFENAEVLKVQEDTGIPAEAVEPLQTLLLQWKGELQQCEDVFVTQSSGGMISKWYIFGGGARTPGLFDVLRDERFGDRVVPLPSHEFILSKKKHIDPNLLAVWSLRLVTAAGLCMRKG